MGNTALDLLAAGIAPELWDAFREGVAELGGELHEEAGLPLPVWAAGESDAAHAEGRRRRAGRFVTVEMAGAEPVVLVRQPFDGDPAPWWKRSGPGGESGMETTYNPRTGLPVSAWEGREAPVLCNGNRGFKRTHYDRVPRCSF